MSTASNRASKLLKAAKSALEILAEQENSRGFPNVVASKLRAAIQEYERLDAAAPELLEALIALTTNKHLNLGDLVYYIREQELEGCDGQSVKAWSAAVTNAQNAIAKATK